MSPSLALPARISLAAALAAGLLACSSAATAKGSRGGPEPAAEVSPRTGVAGTSDREQRFFRVDTLIAQWDAAQADGRDVEAQALAKQAGEEVDKGFADFAAAARGEAGLRAQYLAVKALAFSKDRGATTLLVARLADSDSDLVSNVLISLKVREDPMTPLPPLVALLRSPVPEIRRFAPLAFANVVLARERAGMTMESTVVQQATTNLVGLVQDRDPFVRLHTAKAMGALRRPETNDLLVLLLRDDHMRIRLAAAAALERIGDPRTFPKVVELLEACDLASKVLVRDILVSYAERLEGRPLSAEQKTALDVSPRAWDRWFAGREGGKALPAGTAPAGAPAPLPPAARR